MGRSSVLIPLLLGGALTAALQVAHPALLFDLDLRAHDLFARHTRPPIASSRVAVIDIDEASLKEFGQWPWPREVLARLVRSLAARGAAVVAFDILLPEPDRSSDSADAALARAFAEANVVVGFAMTFGHTSNAVSTAAGCGLRAVAPVQRFQGADTPASALYEGTGVVCNVPVLANVARGAGTINASPDADGVLRRVPLLMRLEGQTFPSLSLAAVLAIAPSPVILERRGDASLRLRVGAQTVWLDERGAALLRQRGAGHAFQYLSAADVVTGRLPPGVSLADRVVVVGATALGIRDVVATARDSRFPGVELHATMIDTLLGGAGGSRPEFADAYELGLALALTSLAVLAVAWFGGAWGGVVVAAMGAAVWWSTEWLYGASGSLVSPIGSIVGLGIGAAISAGYQIVLHRHRADRERARRVRAQQLVVQALVSLTETRNSETGQHARRTQAFARLLTTTLAAQSPRWRQVTPDQIELLSTLAPLHDIGKVGISDAVLNKPDRLTEAELAEMRTHPELGHRSLMRAEHLAGVRDDEVLTLAREIIYTHHERWDGTGYPRGLRGEDIPRSGRVVALVDVYDALVSDRPYRKAMRHEKAVELISQGRGTHFDPDVVDAFLECHEDMHRLYSGAQGVAS